MFYKDQLINLIEILSLAIEWYTVQNVSHKGGWWLIKCSIFLAVWLSLAFKMANIKITHLYIYAAYSSMITSVQWPLWLIWAGSMTGIWISGLILWSLRSALWGLLALQGLVAVIVSLPRLTVPSSRSRSVGKTGCLGAGQSGHRSGVGSGGVTSLSARSAETVEGRTLLAALVNTPWSRILFWECKGDLKGICVKFTLLLYPLLVYPISYHVSEGTWIKPVVVKRFFF